MAAMRAVETKVPMVRVANTGISAMIEPTGQITARTPLFKRGTEIERVSWMPRETVYAMVGDLFAEICFALATIALIVAYLRPRRVTPIEEKQPEVLFRDGHGL
jgi:apolipoprotein N-acyltransferase